MDVLGVERFHLVGAKFGGTIARAFAARRPERVATLIVVGSPTSLRVGAGRPPRRSLADFEKRGVEPWARDSSE
jgi:3-oxoadipate enol-lactonase